MAKSLELRRQRASVIAIARAIVEAAEAENRDLSAEEQSNYDKAFADAEELRGRIERLETVERAGAELGDVAGAAHRGEPQGDGPSVPEFVSRGLRGLDAGWQENNEWRNLLPTATPEYRRAFVNVLRVGSEQRALQADVNTSGGYLLAPMQFVDEMLKAVDNAVYMRQWGRIFSVPNAEALGVPSLENDPADPTWTSELSIGNEDSTMSFGRRELRPHLLKEYIKVSNKMLRKAEFPIESFVRERLAYKFGVKLENAYLNGSGSQQPLGVFTASDSGIPTSRDVSTDNTTTAITFDGLINAKYALKGQYWGGARWLFHRDAVKMISKLTDGNGQYIWKESTRVGEPDTLLGVPVYMSEYAPNTFTTGLYVGILGDFSHYWIADAMSMQMQRLVELFAATAQVGIAGEFESDGMPVLGEAFVRVTLA